MGFGVDFGGSFPRGAVYLSLRAWREGGSRVHFGFKQERGKRDSAFVRVCESHFVCEEEEEGE